MKHYVISLRAQSLRNISFIDESSSCFSTSLQMLKYVGGQEKQSLTSTEAVVTADLQQHPVISTRIVVTDTDVQHSGTYKCEPGAAPVASVNVHVLDGKPVVNFLRPWVFMQIPCSPPNIIQ